MATTLHAGRPSPGPGGYPLDAGNLDEAFAAERLCATSLRASCSTRSRGTTWRCCASATSRTSTSAGSDLRPRPAARRRPRSATDRGRPSGTRWRSASAAVPRPQRVPCRRLRGAAHLRRRLGAAAAARDHPGATSRGCRAWSTRWLCRPRSPASTSSATPTAGWDPRGQPADALRPHLRVRCAKRSAPALGCRRCRGRRPCWRPRGGAGATCALPPPRRRRPAATSSPTAPRTAPGTSTAARPRTRDAGGRRRATSTLGRPPARRRSARDRVQVDVLYRRTRRGPAPRRRRPADLARPSCCCRRCERAR